MFALPMAVLLCAAAAAVTVIPMQKPGLRAKAAAGTVPAVVSAAGSASAAAVCIYLGKCGISTALTVLGASELFLLCACVSCAAAVPVLLCADAGSGPLKGLKICGLACVFLVSALMMFFCTYAGKASFPLAVSEKVTAEKNGENAGTAYLFAAGGGETFRITAGSDPVLFAEDGPGRGLCLIPAPGGSAEKKAAEDAAGRVFSPRRIRRLSDYRGKTEPDCAGIAETGGSAGTGISCFTLWLRDDIFQLPTVKTVGLNT